MVVTALCAVLASSARAQFLYHESFSGEVAAGWTSLQEGTAPGPRLTAGQNPSSIDPERAAPQIDAHGNGWLRLGSTNQNQQNVVALKTPIPSNANVVTITFDFTIWGPNTNSADGLSLFVFDAAADLSAGAAGGSLSYAQKKDAPGLEGGYFGVGLDVFGNFSNDAEGRSSGYNVQDPSNPLDIPDHKNINQVVVRGPDTSGTVNTDTYTGTGSTSYNLLARTGGVNYTEEGTPAIKNLGGSSASSAFFTNSGHNKLNYAGQEFRPDQDAKQYRRMQVVLDENDQLTVRIEFGKDTGWVDLYTVNLEGFSRPENLRLGFGASTGEQSQVHEIRNLTVEASGIDNAWFWTNSDGSGKWDTAGNWDPASVPGVGPFAGADVYFSEWLGNQLVAAAPTTVVIDQSGKTVGSIHFSGSQSYTIVPAGSQGITLDAQGTHDVSYISVMNSPHGNADHTIDANITAANDVRVNNLVDQALTIGSAGRSLAVGDSNIEFDTFGPTTVYSNLSGSYQSRLEKTGVGRLNLYGSNSSYYGQIFVEDGVLAIRNNSGLGSNHSMTTVGAGGSLALDTLSNTTFNQRLTLNGAGFRNTGALQNLAGNNTWQSEIFLGSHTAIGVESGTMLTISGRISDEAGVYDLTKVGGGTLRLTNGNSIDGATTIRAGTLMIIQSNSLGHGSSSIQLGDSGTLSSDSPALLLDSTISFHRNIVVNNYGSTATLGGSITSGQAEFGGNITLNRDVVFVAEGNSTIRLGGQVSDGAGVYGFTKVGTGNLEFNGWGPTEIQGHSYVQEGTVTFNRGGASVISGDLTIGDGNGPATVTYYNQDHQIADSSTVHLNSGGVLDLKNRTDTIGALSGATGSSVKLNNGSLTVGANNADSSFGGNLSGTGTFTKIGSGVSTFHGGNSFTGVFNVNEGTVRLGADNVFSDNMTLRLNGGTFATGGYSDTIKAIGLGANSILDFESLAGVLTFASTASGGLNGNLNIANWNGDLSGGGPSQFRFTNLSQANLLRSKVRFEDFGDADATVVTTGGLHEIVPDLSGWHHWDSGDNGLSGNSNWSTNANWQLGSNESPNMPNSNTANVLIGNQTPGGETISIDQTVTIQNMAITSNNAVTFSGNKLNFDTTSDSGISNLAVTGSSTPTFSNAIDIEDNLRITNSSSGAVTFTGAVRIDGDGNSGARSLTVRGSGLTIFTGVISDNGGNDFLVKEGAGTLRLSGTNSFGGGTTLSAGLIQVGNNRALGMGALTINGGSLEAYGANRSISNGYAINNGFSVTGSNTLTFTSSGNISAGDRQISVGSGAGLVLSGPLTGEGGISKTGGGSLTFGSAANTFGGGLSVTDGSVLVSGSSAVGIGATSGYFGSGDVRVSGGSLSANMNGGSFTIASGRALDVSGGSFLYQSSNSGSHATLDGQLRSSGGSTTINAGGDVTLGSAALVDVTGGNVRLAGSGNFTAGSGSALNISGGALEVDMTRLGSTPSSVNFNAGSTVTLTDGSVMTVRTESGSSVAFQGGSVTLGDGSRLEVQQGNTHLQNGLILDGGSSADAGTLAVSQNLYLGQVSAANRPNIEVSASTDTVIGKDASVSTAQISVINLGHLTKSGAGTTTIRSDINNIEASHVVINQGTLLLGDNDQLANSNKMILAGGTFATGGHKEVLATLTLSADSRIDLGSGSSILSYEQGLASHTAGTFLYVDNWSGSMTGGGTDQIIFGSALSSAFLSNIRWSSQGVWGAVQLASGEIVPVPEPAVIITGVMILGVIGFDIRRRARLKRAAATSD